MSCVKCNDPFVVNKTHQLCDNCNCLRMYGKSRSEIEFEKVRKRQQNRIEKPKVRRVKHNKTLLAGAVTNDKLRKQQERQRKDELTYEEVFNFKPNKCEECDAPLPDRFRDEEGKIVDRFRFSHILSKGAYPEFRNCVWNFNLLCFKCHQIYEFGDRKSMKIYDECKKIVLYNTGFDLL